MTIHLKKTLYLELHTDTLEDRKGYAVFTFKDDGYPEVHGMIKTEEGAARFAQTLREKYTNVGIWHNNTLIEHWGDWIIEKITETCQECDGEGEVENECEECQGTGEVESDDPDENSTCPECQGRGVIDETCENCLGAGEVLT